MYASVHEGHQLFKQPVQHDASSSDAKGRSVQIDMSFPDINVICPCVSQGMMTGADIKAFKTSSEAAAVCKHVSAQ